MKQDFIKNIIELLKVKLSEVENKPDHDEDYDYNSGLEDGLTIAIELLSKVA